MHIVIEPFEARKFPHPKLNLGLFSKSGCNVRMGVCFQQDYFSAGQLSLAMQEKKNSFAEEKIVKISDE